VDIEIQKIQLVYNLFLVGVVVGVSLKILSFRLACRKRLSQVVNCSVVYGSLPPETRTKQVR